MGGPCQRGKGRMRRHAYALPVISLHCDLTLGNPDRVNQITSDTSNDTMMRPAIDDSHIVSRSRMGVNRA